MAQGRMEGWSFDLSYLAPTPPFIFQLEALKTAADSEARGHHSTAPRRAAGVLAGWTHLAHPARPTATATT